MSDFLTMARTCYGEGRGESLDGKIAICWTIKNRAAKGGWWGNSIAEVCLKPKQFSCWDDHNRTSMLAATETTPAFLDCLYTAIAVIGGHIPDPTLGSCHYHTTKVNPPWSEGVTPTVQIGNHLFFNNIE